MKKLQLLLLPLLTVTMLFSMSSCMSEKKILYVQGADTLYATPQKILENYELLIQPDDELMIAVDSKNENASTPYNNRRIIGSGLGSSTATSTTSQQFSQFLVDKEGNINLPVFGMTHVAGKTCRQLEAELEQMFRNGEEKIADAIVSVKMMTSKVSILGDVRSPGTQTFSGERLTLLQAISKAGDLNITAHRENVLVMREVDGKRVTYSVDLRDPKSLFESPAYYLKQNDVVYVRPNKSVRWRSSEGYTIFSIGSTALGVLISVVSLVLVLKNQ